MLTPVIERVTARIIDKSKDSRRRYLDLIEREAEKFSGRGALSCSNLAHGFAAALPTRFDAQFDLLHGATLGSDTVDGFLREANPAAHADLVARFAAVRAAGLWHPRRNDL